MKKFILISIFVIAAIAGYSQERTVSYLGMAEGTYYVYTADALDKLVENTRDTIDFIFEWKGEDAVEKIVLFAQLDTVTTETDSLYVTLYGYNEKTSLAANWTTVIAKTGKLISTDNYPAEVTAFSVSAQQAFRYYRARYVQAANNTFDAGAKFDKLMFKIYTR